jgi:hypothetical protein
MEIALLEKIIIFVVTISFGQKDVLAWQEISV